MIVIEALFNLLNKIDMNWNFKHHKGCNALNITYLCFVDDLMLFYSVEESLILNFQETLNIFGSWSDLRANDMKSKIFFSSKTTSFHRRLVECIGFTIDSLLIKYLKVPLITTKLRNGDFKPLVQRIITRVNLQKSIFLSYMGRIMLIKSILFNIQIYYFSLFILLSSIHKSIENTFKTLFWFASSRVKSRAKVAWENICLPRQ